VARHVKKREKEQQRRRPHVQCDIVCVRACMHKAKIYRLTGKSTSHAQQRVRSILGKQKKTRHATCGNVRCLPSRTGPACVRVLHSRRSSSLLGQVRSSVFVQFPTPRYIFSYAKLPAGRPGSYDDFWEFFVLGGSRVVSQRRPGCWSTISGKSNDECTSGYWSLSVLCVYQKLILLQLA
jgi:hypothetical protein